MIAMVTCKHCNNVKELDLGEYFYDWRDRGMLIQNAMPHLSPADRELVKSAICGDCWDNMFGQLDEILAEMDDEMEGDQ